MEERCFNSLCTAPAIYGGNDNKSFLSLDLTRLNLKTCGFFCSILSNPLPLHLCIRLVAQYSVGETAYSSLILYFLLWFTTSSSLMRQLGFFKYSLIFILEHKCPSMEYNRKDDTFHMQCIFYLIVFTSLSSVLLVLSMVWSRGASYTPLDVCGLSSFHGRYMQLFLLLYYCHR